MRKKFELVDLNDNMGIRNCPRYVSEDEFYALEKTAEELYDRSGIPYEVQRAERRNITPGMSIAGNHLGIMISFQVSIFSEKHIKITPKGGW